MKKKIWKVIFFLAGVLALVLLISAVICGTVIHIQPYTVALDGMETPVRLVVISDLHGKAFGKDNARLLEKIEAQAPDVFFLVGDMLDKKADEADVQSLLALTERLLKIAPVFFSMGNHEQVYLKTDETLLERIAQTGAVVVNDSYADVTLAGQPLRIGGTMGYGFAFGRTEEEFTSSQEYVFLKAFENTELPKICLAHMPDTFIFNGAYTLWDVDLVLSGHTHGGLVRLPFIGGLYAPMQGLFPKYDRGYFQLGTHMQMVITSGLAGHGLLPRVNNLPEIVVVELVPKENG